MLYIFIVNGREDKRFILEKLSSQLAGSEIKYEIYVTKGEGDATRHVRIYNEFHPDEEVCFVACGGSGTLNEVATGIIGYEKKSMALLAYGTGNNFPQSFPGLDFTSVKAIVEGETRRIDAIKCNNDYAINVINFGFDSMAAFYGAQYILKRKSKPYLRGTLRAMFFNRYNRFRIVVDGEKLSSWFTMFCTVANASYYGENFKCAPYAKVDDGHLDVEVVRSSSLLTFLLMFTYFKPGRHPESAFCRHWMKFRNARHVEVSSKSLIYLCVDGEMVASRKYVIDILDKAVPFRFPAASNSESQNKND